MGFKQNLIYAGIFIIFLYSGLILFYEWIDTGNQPAENNYCNFQTYPLDKSLLNEIDEITFNNSNYEYIRNQYDCTQFSQELVRQLELNNYSAECVSGFLKKNGSISPHTWVQVELLNETINLEATGGYIITDDYYYANYRPLITGYCF